MRDVFARVDPGAVTSAGFARLTALTPAMVGPLSPDGIAERERRRAHRAAARGRDQRRRRRAFAVDGTCLRGGVRTDGSRVFVLTAVRHDDALTAALREIGAKTNGKGVTCCVTRIGQLARRSGVGVRALRHHEEQRLLESARTPGGQRDCPDEVLERVQLIQDLFAAGLSSRTVVELLPCVSTGVATPAMLGQLVVERDRIAARVQDLTRAQTELGRVIENVTAPNVAQG
ncbi:MerR family transcriptional regulator [Streptomyces sp. NPDC127119]|uniref:MerR family transcriptional regulator n=1 Tax=Streptomyces sp. NPDC127119 TaxID=3345370 RepID=UPI0036353AC3